MSVSDSRWERLYSAFQSELDERVRNLNALLLQLERGAPDDDARQVLYDGLFREAHSLKGAARAVESAEIEQMAHNLETALAPMREQNAEPPPPWFDAAYRMTDALVPLSLACRPPASSAGEMDGVDGGRSVEQPAPAKAAAAKAATREPVQTRSPGPTHGVPAVNPSESVRVSVGKLDALLAQVGELTVASMRVEQRFGELAGMRNTLDRRRRETGARRSQWSMLRRVAAGDLTSGEIHRGIDALLRFADESEEHLRNLSRELEAAHARLRADSGELRLVSRAIQDEVYAARLLPVATVFAPFERMVRDLAREQAKTVELVQRGADVEIDRRILDQVRDPLMHMLRNAIDHGIEPPEERERVGKPRGGTVTLSATQRSATVEIELGDDGRGIDLEQLRQAAVRTGRISAEDARVLTDHAAMELLYLPGISTSGEITSTSGRGVGMDVVHDNVRRLGGTVAAASVPGQGTRFTISVPLSLATTRALLVRQNGGLYAIPSAAVERAARVRPADIRSVEGRPVVEAAGQPLPAVDLHAVLERPVSEGSVEWRTYLIINQDDRRAVILTDELAGEQEIVVKHLGWPLNRVRNVAGAALLSSGEIAIVLNASDLVRSALRASAAGRGLSREPAGPVPRARRSRVLVVDDSLTTRTLERSILEAAGYDALTAGDGLEALSLLQADQIDLVISDVDMPGLDGFGLTSQIRRTEALRQIPVILLTSLGVGTEGEHRARGMEAGADAYLVKSGFEQTQLLETVGRLL